MAQPLKRKHGTIRQIRYYWNLATFARKFEAEVDAPPEAIADLLSDIEQAPQRGIFPVSRTADIKTVADDETYEFDLRVKHTNSQVNYTSVRANGRIVYSQGYDKTIVRGDIRIGWFYGLSMVASIVSLLVGVLMSPEVLPMMVLFLPYIVFILWSTRRDYFTLTRLVHEKINAAQHAPATEADTDEIELQKLRHVDDPYELRSER